MAANFSFMTVESASKEETFMRQQRKKDHDGLNAHSNKVWRFYAQYVWIKLLKPFLFFTVVSVMDTYCVHISYNA